MSRLAVIPLIAVLTAAVPAAASGGDPRPNIVLLVADDMDYEHFGFAGHPLSQTPTLDELARNGVLFPRGYVPMSRCRPAQAALLTGLWPHQNGVYFNVGSDHIDPDTCLARKLTDAGYATVGEGKFWENEARAMGFSNYTIRNYETFVRWDQRHLFDWLGEQDDEQPFFVWWAPELPHVPHDPPARFLEQVPLDEVPVPAWFEGDEATRQEFRRRERTLLAMNAWLDEGVTQLIAELRQLELLENTLFVFLVDNGWANGCVSKGWAGEKGIRTPIILSWPGRPESGQSHDDLVSAVDIYATILDYADVPASEHGMGHSLRPRAEGRPFEPRTALYGALYPLMPAQVSGDPARDAYALWARTERWKFILSLKDLAARAEAPGTEGAREDIKVSLTADFRRRRGEIELYDLEADPHELHNLAADPQQAETVARLRRETLLWWRSTGGGPLDMP